MVIDRRRRGLGDGDPGDSGSEASPSSTDMDTDGMRDSTFCSGVVGSSGTSSSSRKLSDLTRNRGGLGGRSICILQRKSARSGRARRLA